MKVLITGGGGFVGSRLTKACLNRGYEVVVVDKSKGELEGYMHPNMKFIETSVEDKNLIKIAAEGCNVAYYSAWSFAEKLMEGFTIDVIGFINFMEACCDAGVRHVLFPSSSVIYGEPIKYPITEDHPLLVERSRAPVHAITKLAVEKIMEIYYRERGIPFTIFRFWWAFSDERIPGGTLRKIIDSAIKGESLNVPRASSGSVLYAQDLIRAFEVATLNERAFGKTYNILSFNITWKEFLETIVELAGSKSSVTEVDPLEWKGSGFLTGKWILDDSKIKTDLGFVPDEASAKRAFIEALKKTIESRRTAL
ncbi:MAG: NAD(P)-dependent oxidoreductase [Candidatus Methanomethyliaceae archaeon]|nr:NAD(P)-dependent oxidoreductase [Candidatus Methanomethyliaceae archaeon]